MHPDPLPSGEGTASPPGPFLLSPTQSSARGWTNSAGTLIVQPEMLEVPRLTADLGDIGLLSRETSDPWLEQREDLRGKIREYQRLQRDWGAPGDVPPTGAAVNEALSFLYRIPRNRVLPHVAPAGDGEIVFDWNRDSMSVDVGFFGDGHIYYCVKPSRNTPASSYEEPFERNLPARLLGAIPKMSRMLSGNLSPPKL